MTEPLMEVSYVMTMPEAQAWVIIVSTVVTGIVAVITALKVGTVHKLVNSAMTQEKAENSMLKAILTAKQLEIDSAEKTRIALATATAATLASVEHTFIADPLMANLPTQNINVQTPPIPVVLSGIDGKPVATPTSPVHVITDKK